ncbi:MAG: winged helix-turn-helix domain-containing protein [Nanoarchaeota archaeon]|nr:winged helix-turn-helix domain-containing protein [Nanoarchaeota archaeon]
MSLEDISLGVLRGRFGSEVDGVVKERLHILLLLKEGYVQRDVSSVLHISVGKVPFWKKRFERFGFDGLKDKPRSGRPCRFSKRVFNDLSRRLNSLSPKDKEIIWAGWNTKQARDVIRECSGVEYSLRHVRRLARKAGLSLITPRTKHVKHDEKKVEKFREEFKKKLKLSLKATR